jgi:putative CocE/NonD family hydrolase
LSNLARYTIIAMQMISRIALLLVTIGLAAPAHAQTPKADSIWMAKNYTKREVYITMRDGKRLFTAVYAPKSSKAHEKHPILINRTPYSIAPYGEKKYKAFWNSYYMAYFKKKYIYVMQDVRGRWMSEGEFMDVRPYNEQKKGNDIDEATDTYDAIDWLVKNVPDNNGNVGIFGISYPGFYATMGALCGHPALKAASPQAPVTEWFLGDDFHHNGAFMVMDGFNFYSGFGRPRPKPTTTSTGGFQYYTNDKYKFYLDNGPIKNLATLLGDSIKFWGDLYAHPDYDSWWKVRNARSHVQHIPDGLGTLVVGGLFDAEDCYGAWNLYKAIEHRAHNNNKLVIGPWSHGGWARTDGDYLGNVRFGAKNSEWYRKNVEIPYFEYCLEGKGDINKIKEATIFFSGANEWKTFDKWPPTDATDKNLYLQSNGGLSYSTPRETDEQGYSKYTSDPAKPVPYADGVQTHRTAEYMTDDQRFAASRPDVLVFETDSLKQDLKLGGAITADLFTCISTTDADFVVKLIDVFPDNFSYNDATDGKGNGKDYPMGGYEMLVRGEIMRGKYRNSFEHPEAFEPGAITEVSFKMPDVAHVFKKGHRVMVQIQSSWFPLADRNPQQFVDIYKCSESDFVPSKIKIYSSEDHPSHLVLPVMP